MSPINLVLLFFLFLIPVKSPGQPRQAQQEDFGNYRTPDGRRPGRGMPAPEMEARGGRGIASKGDMPITVGSGKFSRGQKELEFPVNPSKIPAQEGPPPVEGKIRITKTMSSSGKGLTCDSDENFVPLSLLKLITENGEGVEIDSNLDDTKVPPDQKSVSLKVPSYIGGCADLNPKLHQDEESSLLVISVENNFNFDEYLLGKTRIVRPGVTGIDDVPGNSYKQSDLKSMNQTEKFEACMTIKGLLVPDGRGSAELNWPKKEYKSRTTPPIKVSFNPNSNTKVVFGTPKEAGREYGAAYGWDRKSQVSIDNPTKCLVFEELAPKNGMFLYDEQDRKYVSLKESCEGNYLQIMDGLKKAADFAEKDLFKRILAKELDQKLELMAQDRFSRMGQLSKQLNDPKLSREEAERLSGHYLNYVREIDNYYLKPKVEKLRKLYNEKQFSKNLTNSQKDQIDRDILILNRQIAQYSTGKLDKEIDSKATMANLRRLGLTEEAEEIAEFKLYSSYYGRVYDNPESKETRGPKLTPDMAQGQIFKQMAQYKAESDMYDKAYKARTGQGNYSNTYAQRIKQNQEATNKAYMDYQAQEMKNYSYCQMSIIGSQVNPYKCKQVMDSKAVQRRQAQLLEKIKYYQTKTQKDHELYKQFAELEKIGREVKEAEKAKAQKREVANNINEISEEYNDLLDRGNPFHFDYERVANDAIDNSPGNYNMFGTNRGPQGSGGNFNMMGPSETGGQPNFGSNFMAMPGAGPSPVSGGLNQGGFPIGGYRFMTPSGQGFNPQPTPGGGYNPPLGQGF